VTSYCTRAERLRVPPGSVRAGTTHYRLFVDRSAVVRRSYCSLGDARTQSHQTV